MSNKPVKQPYKSVITKRITLARIKSLATKRTNVERLALVFSLIHHITTTENITSGISKTPEKWQQTFPWLTQREVRNSLDNLVEMGMLRRVTVDGKPSEYFPVFNEEDPDAHRQGGADEPCRSSSDTLTLIVEDPDAHRQGCNSNVLVDFSGLSGERVEPADPAPARKTTELKPEQERLLPLVRKCKEIIATSCRELDQGNPPRNEEKKAAVIIEQLIRIDGVPEGDIVLALTWGLYNDFWRGKLGSIDRWRSKGKGNGLAKFLTVRNQWKREMQAEEEARPKPTIFPENF